MCVYKCDITRPLFQIFLQGLLVCFFFFFDMDHFLKIIIEFVTILPLFYVLGFLAMRHVGL